MMMNEAHSQNRARQQQDRRIRRSALAATAVLLLAQLSFIVHVAVFPHVLSPETGEASHPSSGADPAGHFPGAPSHGGHDHECRVFAVFTQASITPVPQVLSIFAPSLLDTKAPMEFEALHICRSDLFRLSPSHSPPALV
jgi:hypothetical protein